MISDRRTVVVFAPARCRAGSVCSTTGPPHRGRSAGIRRISHDRVVTHRVNSAAERWQGCRISGDVAQHPAASRDRPLRHLLAEARDELVAEIVALAFSARGPVNRTGTARDLRALSLGLPRPRLAKSGGTPRRRSAKQPRSLVAPKPPDELGPRIEQIERFDRCALHNGVIDHLVVEDRHAGPAETAAARLDLCGVAADALKTEPSNCPARWREGETTNAVSEQFGLTAGRISQASQPLPGALGAVPRGRAAGRFLAG